MQAPKSNFIEFIPIALLSLLLFASCSQLTIVDDISGPQQSPQPLDEQGEIAQAESESADTASTTETVADFDLPQTGPENTEAGMDNTTRLGDAIVAEALLPEPVLEASDLLAELAEKEVESVVDEQIAQENQIHQGNVEYLCEEIGNKLGSVSVEDCLLQNLKYAGAYSINQRPLTQRDFDPRREGDSKARVLIMGGIHGDEYSSISIMFKWMELMNESGGNNFSWRFLPTVNPDGLLDGQAERQNASGVDLNRNFPSQDWDSKAQDYWHHNTGQNPRRYPGMAAASEPEVRWIIEQIEQYHPEVIVSVHAPYHLLDFDGPAEAPERIGDLYLHQLGVYPGSLGNYAGLDLGIPVVTLELPSAGIMPSDEQIETMWIDMLSWLDTHTQTVQSAAL